MISIRETAVLIIETGAWEKSIKLAEDQLSIQVYSRIQGLLIRVWSRFL